MRSFIKIALFNLLLGMTSLTVAQESISVNINTANAETLAQLPGIGETKAQAIVDDRDANGPFESVEDLDRVSGIGKTTVTRLRERIDL